MFSIGNSFIDIPERAKSYNTPRKQKDLKNKSKK